MNNKLKKFGKSLTGKNGIKNLVISIVILVEILALLAVATFAWVETVSSIKITTDAGEELEIDSYVFTEAMIGGSTDTIDMSKYFKESGDMHFAPCSSADGDSFFFPKKNGSTAFLGSGTGNFRKGNSSDKNTAYMSVTFKCKADDNADFFFEQVPTFSNQNANMRVSVTAYTEGTSKGDLYDNNGKPKYTKVYANSASTTPVVGNTNGTTTTTAVEAFSNHIKGSGTNNRLFAVGANETKIVTINIWLQGTTSSSSVAQNVSISKFGITSSLTPRKVTLYPTSIWSADNPTFYAWCYKSSGSRLYKLEKGSDGHYTFEYNGTYDNLVFVRAITNCSVASGTYNSWPFADSGNGSTRAWNQTEDLNVPSSPPEDPSYFIRSMSGGTDSKSNGYWEEPATIKLAYVNNQNNTWGSIEGESFLTDTNSATIETAKSSGGTHTDTLHARQGQKIRLIASAESDYAFVGWFTDPEGNNPASGSSTSTSYTPNAPSNTNEITYYAKFKKVRTITLAKRLDGYDSSSTACGTLYVDIHPTIGNSTESSTGGSASKIVDLGSTVKVWAVPNTGYSLAGIYSTKTGNSPASNNTITENGITKYLVTADNNYTYYARFTTNTHTVYIDAIGSSGSTVQYESETAATSVSKTGVKYNTSVTIKANPATGYKFVGWYKNQSGTGTAESTSASYTFTLGDSDVHYYAKFAVKNSYYLKASWNSWSESQDHLTASSGNELTFTQELDPGQYEFKIYDGDGPLHWSNAYTYKYKYSSSTDTYLGASGGDTLNSNNETGNMKLNVGYTCKFTFHFNRTTNKFWLTAEDVVTYHVVGDITGGWSVGNNNKMTRVGSTNEYTYSVYVNGNKEFKILTSSGTWYSNGYTYHNGYYGASGGDTFNSSSGNCTMQGNKTYIFHFNSSTKKFWITDS